MDESQQTGKNQLTNDQGTPKHLCCKAEKHVLDLEWIVRVHKLNQNK